MNKLPLVTILTPCYNGSVFLDKYFESISNQDYGNIELIFIDDGSTDDTKDKVIKGIKKLEKKYIKCKYVYQKNEGQAAAISNGLKYVNGEFLMWLDCDDIIFKNCISEKVSFLQKNSEFAFVMCQAICVNMNGKELYKIGDVWDSGRNFFEDLLLERNSFFAPCMYMVRINCLFESLHGKTIENSPVGQNWQLLLPLAYNYKCGYINYPLCYYLVHSDSHSHSINSYEKKQSHFNEQKKLLTILIDKIVKDDLYKEQLYNKLDEKYLHRNYLISWRYCANKDFYNFYEEMKNKQILTKKEKFLYFINRTFIIKICFLLAKQTWHLIKK